MHVRNLEGTEYPLQATITNESELNGNQSISLKITSNKVNDLFIEDFGEMWIISDHDDVEHKVVYAKKKGEGNRLYIEVKGIPLLFDEFDTDRIYEEYNESMTAQRCFSLIFKDTNFNFVLIDSFAAVQWEGFGGGETRIESFKRALERYRCEFRISGKTIYLESQIGRDTSIMYRHKLNASNIVQEIDASALWTYAKGYGDYGDGEGGEDYKDAKLIREYTSPLAKIIGKRHAPPIMDGRVKVASVMDASLKELVDESLKISVSADLHDLTRQNYPIDQTQLGDRVFLIDERINLNEEVRIVNKSITRDWRGNILDLNITFGSEGIAKRHQSNLQTAISQITELLKGKLKLPSTVFDNAIMQAVKDIQNAKTELTFPENGGIWGIDKDDPNYVTGFTSRGFMVSTDGGTTAKAAVTGNGVVAETIIGKAIIGVNLSSVDEKGYFNVNGSDAEFVDVATGRKAKISPDGLFGYNKDNSQRFRVDRSLVTSAALGTSNSNVYLAAESDYEARVVDVNQLPGDGLAASYTYRPIRALGLKFGPNANGYIGTDKEVRITSIGFTQSDGSVVYRDLRCNINYCNQVISQIGNMYIGTEDEVRMVSLSGYNNGNPVYKNVRANGYVGNYLQGDLDKNVYVGTDLEFRVTSRGMGGIDPIVYRPIKASELRNGSSITYKTNIEPLPDDGLYIINKLQIMKYLLQDDVNNGVYDNWQVGILSELSPEVATPDMKAINVYKMLSYAVKAIQELSTKVEQSEQQVPDLEIIVGELSAENENLKQENETLMQRLDNIEQRLIVLETKAE